MKTIPETGIPAAVLAGGASRRMGRDKAYVLYDGVPMIERVTGALRSCVDRIVIIANDGDRLGHLGFPVYSDIVRGMGPLSGLYTAFERTGADRLLLAACDMPLVSPEMIRLILSCAGRPGDAVIPVIGGREEGLLAIYRKSAIDKSRERIESASIQFDEFRTGLEKSHISEEELRRVEPELGSFINVNRPEDIRR